jgi:hypothetical protein
MTDDSAIRGIIASLEHALVLLRRLERDDDVVALILAGGALTLDQAADVWGCSDEKIRKECEKAAANKPIGVKFATRWIVGKRRLFELIERSDGKPARLVAEDRAKKRASSMRPPQQRSTRWNVTGGEPPRSDTRIR